jgi:hypothetical protein
VSTISRFVEKKRAHETDQTRALHQDCFFLALIAFISVVFYISRLGFYSDDWVFLSLLHQSDGQSLDQLYRALYAGDVVIRQRPMQMLYLVLFYKLFGIHPLFYHLANSIALLVSAILFYLVIREFGQRREVALAISIVYLLLPHYSTDRFWVAAHQATFSISFYFLSLYADLRAFREYPHHWMKWKFVSILGLILSGLFYEVAMPLFVLNPFFIWFGARPANGTGTKRAQSQNRFVSLFGVNLLALLLLVVFKGLITVRTNVEAGFVAHIIGIMIGAARVSFGTYGSALPYVVGWILFHHPNWFLLLLSGLSGLLIFFYLYGLAKHSAEFDTRSWLIFIALGLVIFVCGYAIFAINADVWFTSTSLGNRVAIAAAIGVAIVFVGLIGWICSILPMKNWGPGLFCVSVSMLGATGFLINNTLASYWITAYIAQQQTLNEIQQNVPTLPAASTFILDGVCLQQGGAYLFTGKRDLTASLWMVYGDPTLNATVLASSAQIGEEGLSIVTYNSKDTYSYGKDLLIYNFIQEKLYALTDADTARQYFRSTNFVPERNCPPGFAWGWNDR